MLYHFLQEKIQNGRVVNTHYKPVKRLGESDFSLSRNGGTPQNSQPFLNFSY